MDDFSNLIDTNLLGKLSKIKEQNVSLNHFGHILMNSFNKYFHEFGGLNSFKEKKFINFKNIITKHAKDKLYRIPFDEYLEFQKRFDESNEALRKKYFPNRKVLFENVKDYNTNRLMSKNHEELLDQVIKLFSQWIKD